MPTWVKNIQSDANVTNENLVGRVHVADAASPHAGKPVVTLSIKTNDGTENFSMLLEDSSLSGTEQTEFIQHWKTLRDDILNNEGYTQT